MFVFWGEVSIDTLAGVDINELRVGNIIRLEIKICDVQNFLWGELHLNFNPQVLEVVNIPGTNTIPAYKIKRLDEEEGIKIQRGDFFTNISPAFESNKVNNISGKIDYAVGLIDPVRTKSDGVLAVVHFRIKSAGASSKINFDNEDDNRETMVIERIKEPITAYRLPSGSNILLIANWYQNFSLSHFPPFSLFPYLHLNGYAKCYETKKGSTSSFDSLLPF